MVMVAGPLLRVRILLVEDDDDIREGLAEGLSLHGAEVTAASSAEEGLRLFDRERPGLILSDLWMPGSDGLEMIRAIRSREPEQGSLTPAIALSADGDQRTAIMAGFHAFIAKPYDFSELLAVVEDFARFDCGSDFARPWSIRTLRPGQIAVELRGHIRGSDVRNLIHALSHHLDAGPVDVFVDLRREESFAPSIASVGERALWSRRHRIRSAHIIGGSTLARLMAAAGCRILGIPYSQD